MTKDQFTNDEWTALLRAPIAAGSLVATAETDRRNMRAEFRAMAKSIRHVELAGAGHHLVAALIADMTDDNRAPDTAAAPLSDRPALEAEVREAARVVDARCEPGVAEGYKAWVREVAVEVARAAKEGSILGIGGTRVTPEEQRALMAIDELLDVDAEI
ncbi:MAG: hypothetical protein AB1Z57_09085 [Acidimicrobiia bacterium]